MGLAGIPIIGGLFDHTKDDALKEIEKNRALYDGMVAPDIEWDNYAPEAYTSSGEYSPEMAQSQSVNEDPLTRSAQMSALSKMAGLADNGLSAVDDAAFNRAETMGAQQARSGNEAALQNAQARGVGGSGLEFAMREMANQQGAGGAQQAALDRAAAAAQERAMYSQAYGSELSGMRDQDFRSQSRNADALDRFNMQNTQNTNEARQYNLQNAQSIANQNAMNKNQAFLTNQQGRNDVKQQTYQNQLGLADKRAGINNQRANVYWGENARNQAQREAGGAAIGGGIGAIFGGPAGAKVGGMVGGGAGNAF